MFDLDLTKIAVIALVALIVLGPEKLPTLARMAGTFWGRVQRYIFELKSEVTREMELAELKKIKQEIDEQANDVNHNLSSQWHDVQQQVTDSFSLDQEENTQNTSTAYTLNDDLHGGVLSSQGMATRKLNWRAKQVEPLFYRRKARIRVNNQAKRMARRKSMCLHETKTANKVSKF